MASDILPGAPLGVEGTALAAGRPTLLGVNGDAAKLAPAKLPATEPVVLTPNCAADVERRMDGGRGIGGIDGEPAETDDWASTSAAFGLYTYWSASALYEHEVSIARPIPDTFCIDVTRERKK